MAMKTLWKDNKTMKFGKEAVKRKWKKQNKIKYATWNVRGIAHKAEELNSILNEKRIKVAATTESKKESKDTMERNNYIVIYSGVNRSTRLKALLIIWICKSIKHTIINYS